MNNKINESIINAMNYIYNNNSIDNAGKRWCLLGIYVASNEMFYNNEMKINDNQLLSKYYHKLLNELI